MVKKSGNWRKKHHRLMFQPKCSLLKHSCWHDHLRWRHEWAWG